MTSGRICRWLAHRRSPVVIVALGLALAAPAVTANFAADDHLHRILLRDDPGIDGLRSRPFDLFVFASGERDEVHALMDVGVFPWWTDAEAKLAFMRPLSSATHVLDHALWPESATAMLVHNLVWLALALITVCLFYRRFIGASGDARWIAPLALLLYAIDDARGPPVGWIANRNAIIALAFAVPVLLFHDRWRREGWRAGRWLGPLALAVALMAGESALAIGAYLAAHALHLDRASWRDRLLALLPYLAIVILWRLGYAALGYGVHGSGVYIDPAAAPIAFLHALPSRLSLLLLGQFALPWSDLATLYPLIGDNVLATVTVVAAIFMAVGAIAFVPLLRARAESRFFATGMLLAALPVCSTFPGDRLLWFVGLGAAGLVAQLLASAWSRRSELGQRPLQRRFAVVVAIVLALVNLLLSPALLVVRSRSMVNVGALLDGADSTISKNPRIRAKTVILINPPADPFAGYIPIMRAARGEPRPAHLRWLATGTSAIRIERINTSSVRVRPEGGFLRYEIDRMLRSSQQPFRVGDRLSLTDFTVTVESLTSDGRPASTRVEFDRALEDRSLVWLQWRGRGYVPYQPPAIGDSNVLPAIDFLGLITGEN